MAGGTFGSSGGPSLSNHEFGFEGASMHRYDPKLLRKLAATYRARAISEPERSRVFLEIADDMESHARRIENSPASPQTPD
jgi:hypothetical protein